MTPETKYCHKCGKEIDIEAAMCPGCGVLQNSSTATRRTKNPILASFLSFFLLGLGQLYNGEIGKWLMFIGLVCLNIIFSIILFQSFVLYILLAIILMLWSVNDAYHVAKEINGDTSPDPKWV